MESIRWYDKNPLIKEVFEFIQKLEEPSQIEMAKDIIQILMNDMKIDLDKEINQANNDYSYECKRWYDKNPDLHSSFEIIKKLPQMYQKEIMRKIIESALLMYFGHKKD